MTDHERWQRAESIAVQRADLAVEPQQKFVRLMALWLIRQRLADFSNGAGEQAPLRVQAPPCQVASDRASSLPLLLMRAGDTWHRPAGDGQTFPHRAVKESGALRRAG